MKKHKSITILLMCMLLLVSVCAGILFGSVNIAFKDILNYLTGADRSSTSYILITTVRIPLHARRTFCRGRAVLFGCDLTGRNEQFAGKPKHDRCQFRLRFCGHARHDLFPGKLIYTSGLCVLRRPDHHTADLFSGCALRQFKDYDHSCRNYSLKFFKCRHQYDQTFKYGYHGESDVFSDRFPLRAYPKQADPAVPLYCYCILCFLVSRTAVKYARAWG